jgi:hypothetical protein
MKRPSNGERIIGNKKTKKKLEEIMHRDLLTGNLWRGKEQTFTVSES